MDGIAAAATLGGASGGALSTEEPESVEDEDGDAPSGIRGDGLFDRYDVSARCSELLRRASTAIASDAATVPWKWDLLEFLEESRQQLSQAREAHKDASTGAWLEVNEGLANEQMASSLPVGLRKQCEELLSRREIWLTDFDTELRAVLARGCEVRERVFYDDADKGSWFGSGQVTPLEIQRLLERHVDMHQRAARFSRQLKLVRRALQQQGATVSRRLGFQAKTMGEKLQSSMICLAAVAVAPIPGSGEMWLASTTMMLLDKDQAWQHLIYEHPRDADIVAILSQFQICSEKVHQQLSAWLNLPHGARTGCVMVHNASVRRVIVKTHLVNCIDGTGDAGADWTSALDNHPIGGVLKKAFTTGQDPGTVTIGAQRLAIVALPPKPDANWGWRGTFAYGDTKVGECRLREGGLFSFICVDCGLRVGDRGEGIDDLHDVSPSGALAAKRDPSKEALQMKPANGANHITANPVQGSLPVDSPQNPANDVWLTTEVAAPAESTSEEAEEVLTTNVQVVNRTDQELFVKIYPTDETGHIARWFTRAPGEGMLAGHESRVWELQARSGAVDTDFDVEIRPRGLAAKSVKCEVVGEQVVYVDGIVGDSA